MMAMVGHSAISCDRNVAFYTVLIYVFYTKAVNNGRAVAALYALLKSIEQLLKIT